MSTSMLFDELAARWLREADIPHSTLIQRRSVYNLEIRPFLRGRRMEDVTAAEIRALRESVRDSGARAVSLHVRDVTKARRQSQYAEERKHMLQESADMIDAWVAGDIHTPALWPPFMKVTTAQALI